MHIFGRLKFQEIHIFEQKYFQGSLSKKRYKIPGILLEIRTLMYSHSPHNNQAINELTKMIVGRDSGEGLLKS